MREAISVSLPEELRTELDACTVEEGVSRSDLIREALREYLLIRRFRKLRARIIPQAQAQGIFTDEDVFRLIS
ncbi:MAG TPA: ribbon-helix-helix protein, CopG family [Longimicrobiaceae bacterium]|nr:ribbon-helix-helix protein, CopG family [Longimicrobiaceae bacterium]